MAVGAIIAAAVAGTSSALSTYNQGKLSNVQHRSNAKRNEMNASIEDYNAESALKQGEKKEQNILIKGAKLKAEQKVAYANNGVDISSRSVQNVLNETDYFTEADRITAHANAVGASWDARLKAENYRGQAMIERSQISNPLGKAILNGMMAGAQAYMATSGSTTANKPTDVGAGAGAGASAGAGATNYSGFNTGLDMSNANSWYDNWSGNQFSGYRGSFRSF